MTEETKLARLTAERDFLLMRSSRAGSAGFGKDRWTGMSSNALVTVAFGGKDDCLPRDSSDLSACFLTVLRLPEHSISNAVLDQLYKGVARVAEYYPEGVDWAKENSGWTNEVEANFRALATCNQQESLND